jgi:hypothetical protein
MTESNRRHSACKADALPTELITRFLYALIAARTELNQNPAGGASLLADIFSDLLQTIETKIKLF